MSGKRIYEKRGLTVILETDESIKVARYGRIGIKLYSVWRFSSEIALYEMIYDCKDEAKVSLI